MPFLYSDRDPRNTVILLIKHETQALKGIACAHLSKTYLPLILATFVFVVGASIAFLPRGASAFWPFGNFLDTAEGAGGQPVLHDESLPLLKAATHSDPNPNKYALELAISDGTALVANTGVEGTLPEVVGVPNSGQISVYIVRPGDTMSEIAKMFGISVNTILWANDLKKGSALKTGQELIMLPVNGLQYTVKKGDTFASIAKKYSADADDIASFNGLESEAELIAGADIIIPGGELSTPSSTKSGSSVAYVPKNNASLPSISGLFKNPLPNGRLTQGLHGYNGVDIGAPYGSTIYAAASGKVIIAKAGGYNGGYGSYVVIDHGNGAQTLYAHMSTVSVTAGVKVSQGDVIGAVGSTGRSTGNHVHFEVRGGYKNPFAY